MIRGAGLWEAMLSAAPAAPVPQNELLEAAKKALREIDSLPYILRAHSSDCEMQMLATDCSCRCGAAEKNGKTVAAIGCLRTAIRNAEQGGGG